MSISRSENMRRIRSSDTQPELAIRHRLHAAGFRYRLHSSKVFGKPDIVLPARRVAIFIHGCFWHRHEGCARATFPKTNVEYWQTKFERNVSRDSEVRSELERQGWNVMVLWECDIRKGPDSVAGRLAKSLRRLG